jgi:hypothetical protein
MPEAAIPAPQQLQNPAQPGPEGAIVTINPLRYRPRAAYGP